MPAGLIGPLEGLSAYRQVDGDAPSPINYMHVQMKVAGRFVNVLSRIAEAPPDYTGRTNKIAHHIVVATVDQTAGGPAAVLRQPGFAIETWDGEVRKIPEPKTIPPAESPLRVADTWTEQSGDAGWAGVVASIFESRDSGPSLYVIYRPEQHDQLLALIDEATCLLPEPKRWNVTFSTHTGDLPPGVNCRLRCLIAGSSEASTLPPSAMTLDLATGTLNAPSGTWTSPTPGPLVDAARSGRLALPDIMPAEIPTPGVQTGTPIAANQSVSFETSEPNFALQPPPSTPSTSLLPPPAEESSSSTRSYAWPLMVAALLLLCVGGAIAMLVSQTDSDDLLAELNASAGIKKTPAEDVSQDVQQEPDSESELDAEPEPAMKPNVVEDADVNANAELPNVDLKKRESLKELAEKVLIGQAFLKSDDKNSISKFSDRVKNELQRLAEQKKQLEETFPQPTDEQFASWVRAEDGIQQLNGFIDVRKKDIETLKQHLPLKDLQAYRKRLIGELKAWDIEARKWEDEQKKQPDLILEVPDDETVERTITEIRATATTHLQKSMPGLLNQYEKLAAEKNELAAKMEKRLDLQLKELPSELMRRRDSHRLKIYFDGDISRVVDKLQIKPRCYLTFDAEPLEAINRLKVDDTPVAPFKKSNAVIDLPGRYQGWLEVSRDADRVTIRIQSRSIPQSIGKEFPVLEQLKVLADQQEKTITESGKPLRNLLEGKFSLIEASINEKIASEKNKREAAKMALSAEKPKEIERFNEQIRKIDQEIADNEDAKEVLADFRGNTTVDAKTLDELYLDQGKRAIDAFELLQGHTSDQIVKNAIDRHVVNLKDLRRDYQNLKNNLTPFDMGGKLVFGKPSNIGGDSTTNLGQSPFEAVETFDLFFIPELVYGPPPKE